MDMHKVSVLLLLTLCISVCVRELLYSQSHFQYGGYVKPIAKTQKQIRIRQYHKARILTQVQPLIYPSFVVVMLSLTQAQQTRY